MSHRVAPSVQSSLQKRPQDSYGTSTRVHRKDYTDSSQSRAQRGKKRALKVVAEGSSGSTSGIQRSPTRSNASKNPLPYRAGGRAKRITSYMDEETEMQIVKNAQPTIQRNPGPSLGSGASKYRQLVSSVTGMSIISHHIVLGNREDAADIDGLHRIGITHILNTAGSQVPNHHPNDFSYLTIKIQDNPQQDLSSARNSAIGFLQHVEKLNGRVLVHCIAGVSRSVSLVIMHLMATHQIYLRVAFDHIKSCRPFIAPNTGFLLQLAENEIELFGVTTVASAPEWNFYEWNAIKHKAKKYEPVTATSGGGGCILL
mmetsp:Transcript_22307/g.29175  ORF Transcript_22307/g.29175 Transcript_22307/m.29175 type:complete len:314 (+) Transcript_22307:221-1162(+)|eukprot:CAMPEP_0117747510 /NCGR_PEP_ID=MMETSP0947-20121206/8545_1 /TAXON_ID=44440 /ORGANISM="Chattonella subsalsa, Strain CCMP2191" /LENGTH=313 /DNA_ID=CAMNT_0005564959 /DNA_START=136 /DNA_END=1077 /DNA_ORIENTATION=-